MTAPTIPSRPLREFVKSQRLLHRHRQRRLRLRHDGSEAQGMLYTEYHQILSAGRDLEIRSRGGRVPQSLFEVAGDQPVPGAGVDDRSAGGAVEVLRRRPRLPALASLRAWISAETQAV